MRGKLATFHSDLAWVKTAVCLNMMTIAQRTEIWNTKSVGNSQSQSVHDGLCCNAIQRGNEKNCM